MTEQPHANAGRWNAVDQALDSAGIYGQTFKDLTARYGWHHGQSSGALSSMHKAGRIARLTQTRDRCKVYVGLRYVGSRPTDEPGQSATTRLMGEMYALLNEAHNSADNAATFEWRERANDVMKHYENRRLT